MSLPSVNNNSQRSMKLTPRVHARRLNCGLHPFVFFTVQQFRGANGANMGLCEDLAFALLMAGGLTVVSCVGGGSGGGIAGRRSQSPQADGLVIDLGVALSLGVVRHPQFVSRRILPMAELSLDSLMVRGRRRRCCRANCPYAPLRRSGTEKIQVENLTVKVREVWNK
jgi:hypothetical protein